MKILVLGADGYLGWPTSMYLSDKGHEVAAVDNYSKRKIAIQTTLKSTRVSGLLLLLNIQGRGFLWLIAVPEFLSFSKSFELLFKLVISAHDGH